MQKALDLTRTGVFVGHDDVEGITRTLLDWQTEHRNTGIRYRGDETRIEEDSFTQIGRALAAILDELATS